MLRCPLERLVLQAKLLDMGSPKEILALAMNQPDLGNIRQAVWLLKEVSTSKYIFTYLSRPVTEYLTFKPRIL